MTGCSRSEKWILKMRPPWWYGESRTIRQIKSTTKSVKIGSWKNCGNIIFLISSAFQSPPQPKYDCNAWWWKLSDGYGTMKQLGEGTMELTLRFCKNYTWAFSPGNMTDLSLWLLSTKTFKHPRKAFNLYLVWWFDSNLERRENCRSGASDEKKLICLHWLVGGSLHQCA